eukprot:PLAT5950.1.p1 GENE.PLAT5950.1~~PLAT5950.1.p1  ORF type:complete len:278 (+),score=99.56 PLAT5950.1:21-854(+)
MLGKLRAPAGRAARMLSGRATTHFGFTEVATEDKEGMVRDVFARVADRYDLMNDLMSGTLHRLWKDSMISALDARPAAGSAPLRVLDVAGGTGDIAFRIQSQLASRGAPEGSEIVVCDINADMLRVGRDRAEKSGRQARDPPLRWLQGDAMALPLEDGSVDVYTIAFGLRNVTDIDLALREARRVLRKGGRMMCMEFSRVENPLLAAAYDEYSFAVIPALGEAIAQDRESYQYLVESIRQMPPQEELAAKMRDAGFTHVSYENMTFGVVALHSGFAI